MMNQQEQVRKEYGDDTLDGLVPPSSSSSSSRGNGSLEVEDNGYKHSPYSPANRQTSLLFYVATVQAFVIIYRTEVLLGASLAVSLGVAVSSAYHSRHKKVNAFEAAYIQHDYVTSKYDLSVGSIDHWCLRGDDNDCRCEDPLEPMSKRSSRKWSEQHTENVKVAQAALMRTFVSDDGWGDNEWYEQDFDDGWIDEADDDWIFGEGARFGLDDMGWTPWDDFNDDMFADPEEMEADDNGRRRLDESDYELDVVFVGDSLTEQRQGTRMGKPVASYDGIKEVFDKTFTVDKGGEFNGIAMGIAGDTSKNLLWRLMNGEMPWGLVPKVWWVGIGINDLSMKGCSEEVVLLGILRVVEEIQKSQPDSIVVINTLLPVQRNSDGLLEHIGKNHKDVALTKKEKDLEAGSMSPKRDQEDLWPSIVAINEGIRKFAAGTKGVKVFNADSVFVEERRGGKYLKVDLMDDAVHPNLSGHRKWNYAIKKRLTELIK